MSSSSSTSTKRFASELDDITITSESKRQCIDEFEDLIIDGSRSNYNHECFHVNLSPDQHCDVTKLYLQDLIYASGEYTTLERYIRNNPGYNPNYISKTFWTAFQYTKIEKINFPTFVAKLHEVKTDNTVCNLEYYTESRPADIAYLMREGNELIESLDVDEDEKEDMYKRLLDRINIGNFATRACFIRGGDQTREKIRRDIIKCCDAAKCVQGRFEFLEINIRKIKAMTYKLTRYEVI